MGIAKAAPIVALALLVVLSGCSHPPRPEVTESDVVGVWVHSADDDLEATVEVAADGTVMLTDVPSAVLTLLAESPEAGEVDWHDTVSDSGTWGLLSNPCCDQYPEIVLFLSSDTTTAFPVNFDNSSSPLRLFFWYGSPDDTQKFYFDRAS